MYNIHNIFLGSISPFILGEILVGTLAYATANNVTSKSDIDSVVIIKKEKLRDILNSKFLKGLIEPKLAFEVLKKRIADYFCIKTRIKDIELSVDIIPEDFFNLMCNIDLSKQNNTFYSAKFSNLPQINSYPSTEFSGKIHIIKKNSSKFKEGYVIELPLFFVFDNDSKKNYSYGIPTVKLLTSKVNIDKENISTNINSLFFNVIKRMKMEYPKKSIEDYCNYFFNLLIKRNKFSKDYSLELSNKVKGIIKCQKNWKQLV